MELTELEFNDNNFENKNKNTNFGGGLELLMNDKARDKNRPTSDINIEDLSRLENELNDLVEDSPSTGYAHKSDLFENQNASVNLNNFSFSNDEPIRNLGKATSDTENDTKTWDGYGKFNNIPLNPDKGLPVEPKLSKEEMIREKFQYLRKLEALEKKGVELSKKYSMDSSLQEMMGEYETIMEERSKRNSVKFQGNMLMAIINGIEFLNNKFDPFDIKIDGWSEQVQENLTEYDDIFGELHEKYKSKASMAPELKLLFQLGGSAMMVHMTNTMFKSSMPGMDDIFRQNPDLMRSFQNAAVNSMSQTNPGFSGFMSNVANPTYGEQPNRGMGPPPPIATQGSNSIPPPVGRPGNNNFARSDLNFSKSNYNDGINLREKFERPDIHNKRQSTTRPEMKGPSDITDILSGLKTKTINIQEPINNSNNVNNDTSTISLNDLKELQSEGNIPKRSGRRKKSASNTISLDI